MKFIRAWAVAVTVAIFIHIGGNGAPDSLVLDGETGKKPATPPIIGVSELFAVADDYNGEIVCVSGFIGGTGGSGVFISQSREILRTAAARHECVDVAGASIKLLSHQVGVGALHGEYVYVTGKLVVSRQQGAIRTSLRLDEADVVFSDMMERMIAAGEK